MKLFKKEIIRAINLYNGFIKNIPKNIRDNMNKKFKKII